LSLERNLEEIKTVYSHPMAIGQCRSWIMANLPGVSLKELESTSAASQRASREKGTAAIGSRLSARVYNLNTVVENIEDKPDNITRFLCIGKTDMPPTGKDKTSMLFFLKHNPGALHRALGALAEKRINVSRIESRPAKMKKWEYLFFIDLEGHYLDERLSQAIPELERQCVFVKRLGSYPVGGSIE
jgi:chorismate mutase/prephenate dehydratase